MADVHCDCRVGHEAIGHDRLGHHIANALARAGLLPASDDVLAALTDGQLQALPGLGSVAVRRFRATIGGHAVPATYSPSAHGRGERKPREPLRAARCTCSPELLFLGHDNLGHRVSMLLARAGWFAGDADTLASLTDAQLLDIRHVGPTALARVREHIGHPPSSPAGRR